MNGAELADHLEKHQVLIRRCASFDGVGDGFVRLAVRSETENRKLVTLLADRLREETL